MEKLSDAEVKVLFQGHSTYVTLLYQYSYPKLKLCRKSHMLSCSLMNYVLTERRGPGENTDDKEGCP